MTKEYFHRLSPEAEAEERERALSGISLDVNGEEGFKEALVVSLGSDDFSHMV